MIIVVYIIWKIINSIFYDNITMIKKFVAFSVNFVVYENIMQNNSVWKSNLYS